MKATNTKKLIRSIIFSLMICAILAIGLAIKAPQASAQMTDEFTFTGASVRLDSEGDTSGLRFTARFDSGLYDRLITDGEYNSADTTLGMIIVPDSYINDYDASGYTDYFTYFKEVKGKEKSQISTEFGTEKIVKTGDGVYQISGALVSIKYANYERLFRPIAYYTEDGVNYTYQAGTVPKSINGISRQAIEQDQQACNLTDRELDILYTYADGYIKRIILDASKQAHAEKLLSMMIEADGSSTWTATKETVTVDGTDYFKISTESLGDTRAIAFSYIIEDTTDLSLYDFVLFELTFNRSDIRVGLGDPSTLDETGVWHTTVADEPYYAAISRSFFVSMANMGSYSLMAKDLEVCDIALIGDFVAYSEKSIETMIDTLPTEGVLTKEQKATVDELRTALNYVVGLYAYTDYLDRIDNYDRLLIAEQLAMAALDATDPGDLDSFSPIDLEGDEIPWEATVTQVVYGGYELFKFTVTQKGSSDLIVHSFTFDGAPLDGYDYMLYSFMTDGANVEFGLGDPSTETYMLSPLAPYTYDPIYESVDNLIEYSEAFCFVAKGLEEGESIYFGDYLAFSKDTVKHLIECLPEPEDVTEGDRASIEMALKFYNYLTDSEPEYADPTGKLALCIEALERFPYTVMGYDSADSDEAFTELAGSDEFEVAKEVLYGTEWFRLTATKINYTVSETGDQTHCINAGLEAIGLDANIRDFDYVIFNIRIDVGEEFACANGYTDASDTDLLINDSELINYLNIAKTGNSTAIALIDGSFFKNNPFCDIALTVKGLELGESVWISSIMGVTQSNLRAMIDALPDPDAITGDDRAQFDSVYYYYNIIDTLAPADISVIDPDGKFLACKEAIEAYDYIIYSTDAEYAAEQLYFEQFEDDGVNSLICTVIEDGMYELQVLEIGSKNAIGFSYSIEGMDLSAYKYVSFWVGTTGSGLSDSEPVQCNITDRALNDIGGWVDLSPGEMEEVIINVDDFVYFCGNVLLSMRNLQAGDTVYISSFTVHN